MSGARCGGVSGASYGAVSGTLHGGACVAWFAGGSTFSVGRFAPEMLAKKSARTIQFPRLEVLWLVTERSVFQLRIEEGLFPTGKPSVERMSPENIRLLSC